VSEERIQEALKADGYNSAALEEQQCHRRTGFTDGDTDTRAWFGYDVKLGNTVAVDLICLGIHHESRRRGGGGRHRSLRSGLRPEGVGATR
jgi:hypothetical protein